MSVTNILDQGEGGGYAPMLMQVSSLNTAWLIKCIRTYYLQVNPEDIVRDATAEHQYYIKNIRTGLVEPIAVSHLESPDYWFSNLFMISLYHAIEKYIPDPEFAYSCGRTFYKTQSCLKTAIGVPLIGPYRLIKRMVSENHKYNRTKDVVIRTLEKGRVVIRLIHKPNVVMNDFGMKWHLGAFESYGRLAGVTRMKTTFSCVEKGPSAYGEPGQAIYDFELVFEESGLFRRLCNRLLYAISSVREIIDNADRIQAEHNEQILNRDRLIENHTNHLLKIQEKLMSAERMVIENRLKTLSAELIATEERERRAIAEDLHDSITQLLALSVNGLKREIGRLQERGELETVRGYVQEALAEVRSLTFQISPPVLYDFGLESALEWLANDLSERHPVDIDFMNLLERPLKLSEQEKIILYRTVRETVINCIKHAKASYATVVLLEEEGRTKIEVEDNGVGFDPTRLKKGFGLSAAADRLAAIEAGLDIISSPGNGARIILELGPVEARG
jgi:signal transduction histidine kinase